MRLNEIISNYSPWIQDSHWEKQDRNLIRVHKSGIHFRHFSKELHLLTGSINIFRGLRQVGKTTEIKLIIKDLLDKGVKPQAIFYIACDNIITRKELHDTIIECIDYWVTEKISHGYLFLDEITSIKDWQKTIKGLVDLGKLDHTSVIITGSSAIEIKRGYERMPGRRGKGLDHIFLPMDFYHFCTSLGISQTNRYSLFDIAKNKNIFNEFKSVILLNENNCKKMLNIYFQNGGFPFVVSEVYMNKSITPESEEIISSIIFSEIEKAKLNINNTKSILVKILSSVTSALSYNTVAADTNIYSAEGVKKYLEILTAAFITFSAYSLNLNTKSAFPKKNKKIYISDFCFFNTIKKYVPNLILDESKLAEISTAMHLIRYFGNQWATFASVDNFYYWHSKKGKEIDFVLFKDNKPFGIEVKYQNTISGWDELSIKKGIGHGVLVTKNTFEFDDIPKIPLWAFLLTTFE